MLAELAIRNFAIIDELHLQFDDGMNALTGETGAGKSIIIDALGAVLGERVGSEVVRTGASAATTEAVFDLADRDASEITALLDELGIEDEDGTLILSRQIAAGGRSSARINGRPVTVGALNQLGALLIDIHGQSDHLKLLQAGAQLDALDHYAGTMGDREHVRELVRELHAVRSARNRLRTGEREREQRVDLLKYQVDEISSAALEPDEDERIANERAVLANAERLIGDAAAALQALEPDDDDAGAASLLRSALQHVQRIAEVDASTAELSERINEVVVLADDVASDLRRYVESVDADPARLASVEERFDLIQKLKRKYGATIPEIQAHLEAAQAELETLTGAGFDEAALAEQETELEATLAPVLDALSTARRGGADRLETAIDAAIAELGLGSAHVSIAISTLPDPTETGADAVEFLFAPNKGEALKPLAKIASGGETARLMLALKSVLAEGDRTPTLVFDEVDVGVGARSGQSVGEKLWSLANRHQVIVISHLAQIAAFAGAHFMIEKDVAGDRTVSTVRRLEGGTRLDELAEMIDGKPVSPESRAAAEQLMDRISSIKRTGG
ncbi:MAG TPA: DNA repair protein RecN [Thermomicrobiales bacterium]|jgi:DNA repair protein RecN (Recombination protein N)|nr:DNA repair protein RecN [Thermomicrobiales bacterium]